MSNLVLRSYDFSDNIFIITYNKPSKLISARLLIAR